MMVGETDWDGLRYYQEDLNNREVDWFFRLMSGVKNNKGFIDALENCDLKKIHLVGLGV